MEGKPPKLLQVLPAGTGPEGILAIPQRDLFVAASEVDDRGDKIRSSISIYQRLPGKPAYPNIVSAPMENGKPIPWGAMSGMATDPVDGDKIYSVPDSFYGKSRIYTMDVSAHPVTITSQTILKDAMGKLAAFYPNLVNGDETVNVDLEGIAAREDGGFWLVSEGNGSVDDEKRPVKFANLLLKVAANGMIEDVVLLPETVNQRQHRFGFEGVTTMASEAGEKVYVAFQREWLGDPKGMVRIGEYTVASGEWNFFYYPLDKATSPNGGWVGLSEISATRDGHLLVLERDNQGGPDATIKRIYDIDVSYQMPKADPGLGAELDFPVLDKYLQRDLLEDFSWTGGTVLEKVEGMALLKDGTVLVVNDNDGVDDSNGETQILPIYNLVDVK